MHRQQECILVAQEDIIKFVRERDYKFIRELGQGACGKTVLLYDDQIDEHFVCKKFVPIRQTNAETLYLNFVREIQLLHQLLHRNVVRVYNYYLYPQKTCGYILMEFVDGWNIEEYLSQSPESANEIFLQAVSGFRHLEQNNILHRDIRPGNLLIGKGGTLKIIDLGFGKQVLRSVDYTKSIELNWWCPVPQEFDHGVYDFSSEVYFVGMLFHKFIRGNNIKTFKYMELLQRMCEFSPEKRIATFSEVDKATVSDKIQEAGIRSEEVRVYRSFADALLKQITEIEVDAKYVDEPEAILGSLEDAYERIVLEEFVPDARTVIRCFIKGAYRYESKGLRVKVVREFIELLKTATREQSRIVLLNLQNRFDAIDRWYMDLPF